MKRFSETEDQFLRDNYQEKSLNELAASLGRHSSTISGRMKRLNLIVPKEIKQMRWEKSKEKIMAGGKKYRFQKGHVPANKGKKMSADVRERIKHTWFEKGHTPKNHMEVGSITKTTDGYLKIKMEEPNIWELLHRHNWIKYFGPIPDKMIVAFKDGIKTNCEPENLELITMEENMKRNTIHNYPEEIVQATLAVGRLTRAINKKLK